MAAIGGKTFPAALRLRRSAEFQRARLLGRKFHTAHFIVYLVSKTDGPNRLGVTASRKVGGSVQRNRIKRLLREFFRQHREMLPCPADYSVIAKKGASSLDYRRVCEEFKFLFSLHGPGGP